MKLAAGDIVFTSARGGGFIGKNIRWWTRTWFEPPTTTSHVAIVVKPAEHLEDCLIVEQTWPRIQLSCLGKYRAAGFEVYRDTSLPAGQLSGIASEALGARGPYGSGKILLFLLDAVLGKVLSLPVVTLGLLTGRRWRGFEPALFTQLNLSGALVCSQFVARLWWDRGYHLGTPWYAATPDALLDYCRSQPDRFISVPLRAQHTH